MIAEALKDLAEKGHKHIDNLNNLYRCFIEKKYKIYHKEKLEQTISRPAVIDQMEKEIESYAKQYSNLALNELFGEDKIKSFINEDGINVRSAVRRGFINVIDDKASFIQRTFAEYAAAGRFFDILKKKKDHLQYKSARDFLRNHIFEAKNEALCTFLDYKLAEASEIHTAVLNNNTSVIPDLLSKGIDINAVDRLGRTPLHLAAANGCKEVVKFLLEAGADINAKDEYGKIPLYHAVTRNKIDACVHIVKHITELETFGLKVSPQDPELKTQVAKIIFLHNHKPLIDVLSKYYGNEFQTTTLTDIKAFFQKYMHLQKL